jgi:hypothetical protein
MMTRYQGCVRLYGSALKGGLFSLLLIVLAAATAGAQTNPIVVENQQPGSTGWDLGKNQMANDTLGQIKGYASAVSINKGESINFHVSVNPAQTYTIDVYRIGWYGGLGGRLMAHIGPLDGTPQPTCPMDAVTGMIECHWAVAYTLATQTSWTSGVYFAVMRNAQAFTNYMVFVVRDDTRSASLIYQQAVTTYQAYNNYPNDGTTGKSLYDFNSYGAILNSTGWHSAAKVSFDRPYADTGINEGIRSDYGEINFIRWVERSGYDVTYNTDLDTHLNPGSLLNYRGFLSVGHDEYWSKPMYDAAVAARDAGVNLAFFGADAVYWQIRFEPSTEGVANRVVVCYKDKFKDPTTNNQLKTVLWRDPLLGRPEQTLMGVQYFTAQPTQLPGPLVIKNPDHWVWYGTGFVDGEVMPSLVGYEADRFHTNYPGPNAVPGTHVLLSRSPWGTGPDDFSHASIYQAPSGAWVFATGSMDWNWALDSWGHGSTRASTRIQRASANVIERFIGATMTTPAPATVLSGANVTFTWRGTKSATSYWLEVGTTVGGHEFFGGSAGVATSQAVTGLPLGGGPIKARLWTQINGRWLFNDYSYTALNVKGTMTSPIPGSVLGGGSVTFSWNPGTEATAYWLEVGTAVGGHQLFGQGSGLATSQLVTGLPTLGGPLYVRLWTQYHGSWLYNDYTYTAFNAKAAMTSPIPGSVFGGKTVTFTWSAGTGASSYWLEVGSTPGGHNFFGQSVALATSQIVTGLPMLGGPVYVRLWTELNGAWRFNDYTYTAVNAKAAMTAPTALETSLSGSSVTFTWSAGAGGTAYWLDVGKTGPGSQQLFGQNVGLAMSHTVNGLPVKGETIYVRLWTQLNGSWIFNDYTYTAADARARMMTPVPGSVLTAFSATFSWTAGIGASQYWLEVGTTGVGSHNIFGQGAGLNTSQGVTGLPVGGNTIYVRLWTLTGSSWQFIDYTYVAAHPD